MEAYRLERDGGGGPGTVYQPDGTPLDPDRSQEIIDKSPTGFQWGYKGSGPHQLALALLLDLTDDPEIAQANHHQFTVDVISNIEADDVKLRVEIIDRWLRANSERYANQP